MSGEASTNMVGSITQSIELTFHEIEKNINTAKYCNFLILRKENQEEAKQKYPEFEQYYQKHNQNTDEPQDLRSERIKYEDTLKILCPRLADQREQVYNQLTTVNDDAQQVIRDELFNMVQNLQKGSFKREDIGDLLRNVMGATFKEDDEKLTKFNEILAEVESRSELG